MKLGTEIDKLLTSFIKYVKSMMALRSFLTTYIFFILLKMDVNRYFSSLVAQLSNTNNE